MERAAVPFMLITETDKLIVFTEDSKPAPRPSPCTHQYYRTLRTWISLPQHLDYTELSQYYFLVA
jgi:hypothetical protein